MPLTKKDFLSIADFTADELNEIINLAIKQKADLNKGPLEPVFRGKTLGCIFHKPSLRTRVSFEVAMHQLGGSSMFITEKEIGIGSREAPQDVGRVLSRYLAAVMIRTFDHSIAETLAKHATIPVINGLTDLLHPCQIMADLMTVQEHRGNLDNLTVAFIGDGNNVARSWINAAGRLGFRVVLGCPAGYGVEREFIDRALAGSSGRYEEINDPAAAVKEADVLYTDVWASMGQEDEAAKRRQAFSAFQLNPELVGQAPKGAYIMHCLPAHRGEEITDDVIESENSIVFDEAENRLHAQRALLTLLVQGGGAH
ncbi:MAG: ornithine carbamoyltransferase [Candidatus Latescibacterota bacterium]|nr:MAG: ornithine carbamoyltransferase [Candidatus Latescibacterota bacterium]